MLTRLLAAACSVLAALAAPSAAAPSPPAAPPGHHHVGPVAWTEVGTLQETTCGLAADRTAWCWGDDPASPADDRTLPEQLPGRWRSLSLDWLATCGVRVDRSGWCLGRLGTERLPGRWRQVDATSSCGITAEQRLRCWGSRPVAVPGRWRSVAATGFGTACAVRTDGSAWCWGTNRDGLLGVGKLPRQLHGSKVPLPISGRWASIRFESSVACGLQTDATLWCWGALWTESGRPVTAPTQVPGSWSAFDLDESRVCGLHPNGSAGCAGYPPSPDGSVPLPDPDDPLVPAAVPGRWTELESGDSTVCGLTPHQRLVCWGRTLGGYGYRQEPRTYPGRWRSLALDQWGGTLCGLHADGSAWCLGENGSGQLGDGTTHRSRSPVRVGR